MKTQWVGVDAGSVNFALVGLSRRGEPTFARMLQSTIGSTAKANAELRPAYRRAVRGILQRLRPRGVTAESFTVRGFGTNSIELVGLMLGSLQESCDVLGVEEHLVMASTWKRQVKAACGEDALDSAYAHAKSLRCPPHAVDAALLGTYGLRGGSLETITRGQIKSLVGQTAALLPEYQRLALRKARTGSKERR